MEIGFNLSDAKVLAPSMETFDGFHRRGHIFHRPTIQRGSNTALIAVALIAAGSLVACSSGARSGSTTLAPSVSQSASSGSSLTLVALGDSIPFGGPTCDGCRSFVNLFADAMTSHIGTRVVARNLVVPGATSDDLLDQVTTDQSVRPSIAAADVVTVTIGHNDTPWNRGDDACDGRLEAPDVRWNAYTASCVQTEANRFGRTLDSILSEITNLRGGKPTMLRITNDYNDVIGLAPAVADGPTKLVLDAFTKQTCQVAEKHGAPCADVYHAFNGAHGTNDAGALLASDHTHPNQEGQQLIADLLVKLGYAPLAP